MLSFEEKIARRTWLERFRRPLAAEVFDDGLTQAFLPIAGGYLAVWVFDEETETGEHTALLCILTRREARKIVKRDIYNTGFLEPVRSRLKDPDAYFVKNLFCKEASGKPFRIPAYVTEEGFVTMLDDETELAVTTKKPLPKLDWVSSLVLQKLTK